MNIKHLNKIKDLCEKYSIKNYTVNDDGSIDVDDDIYFVKHFTKLPLIFNRVTGNFWCFNNKLTTLKGAPNYVGGNFNCSNNRISSLEFGPKYVKGSFTCTENKLTSMQFAPSVFTKIYFSRNPIYSILNDSIKQFSSKKLSSDQFNVLFKYHHEFDVWTPKLNEDNLKILIEEIKDGLL